MTFRKRRTQFPLVFPSLSISSLLFFFFRLSARIDSADNAQAPEETVGRGPSSGPLRSFSRAGRPLWAERSAEKKSLRGSRRFLGRRSKGLKSNTCKGDSESWSGGEGDGGGD